MATSTRSLQIAINNVYVKTFGRTPLRQRLHDVLGEALELSRYTDLSNLREETSDLLGSLTQLINECGWDMAELANDNISKIEARAKQYRTLGRKKSVAIYGGAFDPPHLGHLAVAQFVLNTSSTFDEVWVMPCYKHINGKSMSSAFDRIEMCRKLFQRDGRIKVSDFEILHEFQGETYHLVKTLLAEDFAKNEYDFSVIIGQDNAESFDKWVNFQDLERMVRFVVVPRKGVTPSPEVNWYLKPPHIYLVDENTIPNISSTKIRYILGEKGALSSDLSDLISPEVAGYIHNHNLFRSDT